LTRKYIGLFFSSTHTPVQPDARNTKPLLEITIWHYISISLTNDRQIHWAFHELLRKSASGLFKTGLA